MKTIKCPQCGGIGKIPQQADWSKRMRELREESGVSLSEVARRIGVSKAYLSDMELGRRAWNPDKERRFRIALAGLLPNRTVKGLSSEWEFRGTHGK